MKAKLLAIFGGVILLFGGCNYTTLEDVENVSELRDESNGTFRLNGYISPTPNGGVVEISNEGTLSVYGDISTSGFGTAVVEVNGSERRIVDFKRTNEWRKVKDLEGDMVITEDGEEIPRRNVETLHLPFKGLYIK